MYKIKISKKVYILIDNFIGWFLNWFIERFNDTGIFSENIIKHNYIISSEKLKDKIFDIISLELSQNKILAYKVLKNNILRITFLVWNYIVFIEYTQNETKKIRYIKNINFNSK